MPAIELRFVAHEWEPSDGDGPGLLEVAEAARDILTGAGPGPLEALARWLPLSVWQSDAAGLIVRYYSGGSLGVDPEAVVGVPTSTYGGEVGELVERVSTTGEPATIVTELFFGERRAVFWTAVVPLPDGGALAVAIERSDGTLAEVERRRHQQALEQAANQDPVTLLGNRHWFDRRLATALAAPGGGLALLLCHIDGLAFISGSLGIGAGDVAFRSLAGRIDSVAGASATVARYGEQLVAVLLEDPAGGDVGWEVAEKLADRLLEAVAEPLAVQEETVHASASIGIALAPREPGTGGELTAHAGMAMSAARAAGGGRRRRFDPAMRAAVDTRRRVETELRRGIDADELVLYYQPIVSLADGRPRGFEALLRWRHLHRGVLLPAEFMAVAEQRGLIVPMGSWVLDEACRQLAAWGDTAPDGGQLQMAVNISARQLGDGSLVDTVAAALGRHGVSPGRLSLEITETALLQELSAVAPVIEGLVKLGVRLSLDDFGTGFSSLTHLLAFPIDTLKVDRTFISALPDGGPEVAVVEAVVQLARALGLTVVAEGVEREAQADALATLGCDLVQGFLYATAAPSADATRLIGQDLRLG